MKKNVLALSIATAVVGFAGSAHAIQTLGTAATATELAFSDTGIGHMLLVPYFSTQNGNATLLSLVNTDTVNGKAVKVRFRGAKNSDDIFDFQVFLSPGDVWTANVSQNANGTSTLTTEDNSCTRPKSVNGDFVTSRVSGNAGAETLEGYVEIFNMADVAPDSNIYKVIKHVNGTAPCWNATGTDLTAWTGLSTDKADEAAYAGVGLVNPTTGLMANWTIMNVPKALSWSGAATAIQAVDGAGAVGTGNVVYFPQQNTPVTAANLATFTADPLLTGGQVAGALYDLPDMSTPYLNGVTDPSVQAGNLANSIAATNVINEFWTDDTILANTDWVFSMPTRRYAVAMDYKAKEAVYNEDNANHFAAGNTTVLEDAICVTDVTPDVWGREEENEVASSDDVISPGTPEAKKAFCGETSILSFGTEATAERSAVLGAKIALSTIDAKYQNGWANLSLGGAVAGSGLPVLGSAFASAYNQAVEEGTAGNFSVNWAHRFIRPVAAPAAE
ncbi:cell surface protein [Diaphorobacter ruginosibacter]|uniref:cell surface protein n=1 Tax=Diaphorobacter ruginosibacter TaxID=1715720 RepID=UPI003341F092